MFFSIQKLLSQSPKTLKKQQKNPKNEEEDLTPSLKNLPCSNCFGHGDQTNPNQIIPSARSSRSNFAKSASSSLFPNTNFTNHESLPSLPNSFSSFSDSFPQYRETLKADFIRETQYIHLENHVCLDYSGVNLFSHAQMNQSSQIFTISYKSASIRSELQYGEKDRGFEFSIRSRIMNFLKVSGEDYGVICTANRSAAFRLLAETYPFESNKKLVTVYDYESEAVSAMSDCAAKRGAKIMSASFIWPGMRIHSTKLKKILRNGKNRGLFVFPHMSRVSGVRYPYLWVKLARDNGWHVILDACTLGPKDMNSLILALIQPDFIICSFFKVFGENPAGFATLFIKKSSGEILKSSVLARSIGMVNIVRAGNLFDFDANCSFSGPILPEDKTEEKDGVFTEIVEEIEEKHEIEFHGLDHADSLGLLLIHNRLRCIVNWLVIALMKLHHPNSEKGDSLVKIYGPRVKFDRGAALAFNVFDWKGEKIDPLLVQKLADRNNISLSCGFLQNIVFLEKYERVKEGVLEERLCEKMEDFGCGKKVGIAVVNASFGYLANFEDAYRLWAFVAKFLDADFVEKERWRYVALNQKMIEL